MTKFALAFLAIAALQPVAHANDVSNGAGIGATSRNHKLKMVRKADEPHSRIAVVPSANSCAPDQAEPVWRENGVLVGYSCLPPTANGG
jgi:hypothetical protein